MTSYISSMVGWCRGSNAARFQHSDNDFELVVKSAKHLEFLLENLFNAEGMSVHEKLDSLGPHVLSTEILKQMRYLATIRNKMVHEPGFDALPDRDKFISCYENAVLEMERVSNSSASSSTLPSSSGSGSWASWLTGPTATSIFSFVWSLVVKNNPNGSTRDFGNGHGRRMGNVAN
jgi:hypothetical protein